MLLCILDLLVWTPLWLLHFSKWPIMRHQCQLHFWCNLMALLRGKGSNIKSAHTLPAAAHGSVCAKQDHFVSIYSAAVNYLLSILYKTLQEIA